MLRFRRSAVLAACVICLAFLAVGNATVLTPGPGAFTPDTFVFCTSSADCPTMLTSMSVTQTSSNSKVTATVNSAVYSDPTNIFGAGDLTFVYQVLNSASSKDSIGRFTAIDFTGFKTDVGITPNGGSIGGSFTAGGTSPQLVDRVSDDVVGFSFNAPLTQLIAPGSNSIVLVIQTDAKAWTAGEVNVIDGGVTTIASFQPTTSTSTIPEPTAFLLIGTGLLGLAGVRRFHKH